MEGIMQSFTLMPKYAILHGAVDMTHSRQDMIPEIGVPVTRVRGI